MNNKMVKIVVTSHLDGTVNHVMMDEMVKIINSLFDYYVDAMNNNRWGRQLNSPFCTPSFTTVHEWCESGFFQLKSTSNVVTYAQEEGITMEKDF